MVFPVFAARDARLGFVRAADPFDATMDGKPRKLVALANRNAFYYVLDRATGEFISGVPFAKQTWAKGLDAKGRPINYPAAQIEPSVEGTLVYPSLTGAINWTSPCYSPLTGLFYVNARERAHTTLRANGRWQPGNSDGSGRRGRRRRKRPWPAIELHLDSRAECDHWREEVGIQDGRRFLDRHAGDRRRLVFSADAAGDFFALDAKTGEPRGTCCWVLAAVESGVVRGRWQAVRR